MTTADALRAAKALIPDEDHWSCSMSGHARGYGERQSDGSYMVCMAGAVYVAVNGWRGDGEPSLLDSVLTRAALGAPASVIGDGVADFNDFPNRTLSEIHDAYDEAVALTEAA